MKIVLFLLMIVLTVSCNKTEKGPDEALLKFVEYRMSPSQTIAELLQMTTGKAHDEIVNLNETDQKNFVTQVGSYKKKAFKITVRKCTENNCFMTYLLAYDVLKDGKTIFSSEVKKIAELELIEGVWKVADISNIKTFFQSIEPITP